MTRLEEIKTRIARGVPSIKDLEWAVGGIEWMQPIIDRLPKTANGVPITPGMQSDIPCCRCGGVVVEFSLPNDAWNTLIRRGGKETDQEYLCLACFSYCAAETVERLQAIVDKLPTTADGVPVVPGMSLFVPHQTRPPEIFAWDFFQHRYKGHPVEWHIRLTDRTIPVLKCYSTREAAEAAR